MNPRTTARLYWSLTGLFCLLMLADGLAGLLLEKNGQAAMLRLGYPLYIMPILGTAKILGALVLLQTRYHTLKEWAFAGFTVNFLGAAASVASAGMGFGAMLPALAMQAVLLGLYLLWQRYRATQAQGPAAGATAGAAGLAPVH